MKAKKIIGLILAVCLLFGITLMIAVGAAETPEAVPATEVDTVDALQAALNNGGAVKLVKDVEGDVTVTTEATIDLNGYVLHGGITIPGKSGGKLTLIDSRPDSAHSDLTYLDPVDGKTEYEVKGGAVTGKVNVNQGGYFNMEAGTLTGSGGIYVKDGTAVMSGGMIAGIVGSSGSLESEEGTWSSGGPVFVDGSKASFTMKGGIITCNSGRDYHYHRVGRPDEYERTLANTGDLGITVTEYAVFNMEDGLITKNVHSRGGALSVFYNGTFNMTGGEISYNVAGNGGAVYMCKGNFSMSDGTIAYNKAVGDYGSGGALGGWNSVYWNTDFLNGEEAHFNLKILNTVSITGGSITGNSADQYGGGLYLPTIYDFEISGASVTGNSAGQDGGGIYLPAVILRLDFGEEGNIEEIRNIYYPGTVTIKDCTITGNTAGGHGGGILVPDMRKTDPVRYVNERMPFDGFIYFPKSYVNMSGKVIVADNTSGKDGEKIPDNVYLTGDTVITAADDMTGSVIGVTAERNPTKTKPVVFTNGLSGKGGVGNFTDDSGKYFITLNAEEEARLQMSETDLTFEKIWFNKDGDIVRPDAEAACMLQVSHDGGKTWKPFKVSASENGFTYSLDEGNYDAYDIVLSRDGDDSTGIWRITFENLPAIDEKINPLLYRLIEDGSSTVVAGESEFYCIGEEEISYSEDGTVSYAIHGSSERKEFSPEIEKCVFQENLVIINYEIDPDTLSLVVIKGDSSDPDAALQGAEIALLDDGHELLADRTTGADGKAEFPWYILPPASGTPDWGPRTTNTSGNLRTVTYTAEKIYYLRENKAPDGYLILQDAEIIVSWTKIENYSRRYEWDSWVLNGISTTCSALFNGEEVTVDNENGVITVTLADEKSEVYVLSFSSELGQAVEGGLIRILDKNGSVADEWSPSADAHVTYGLKTDQEYTIRVITAPDGFTLAQDVSFTIGPDGKITTTGTVKEDENGNAVILVENELTVVRILKVDENGDPLAGASIEVLDPSGNLVDGWISSSDARVIIGLNTNREYTIRETDAPEGFTAAQDVVFTIGSDGRITTTGTVKEDENGVVTILVENDKTVFEVKFVDEDGAVLQSGTVNYGNTFSYTGKTPVKKPDAHYTYTFIGWSDGTNSYGKDEKLPAVTAAVIYTAVYDKIVNSYEITWLSDDGSLIDKTAVEYGETPVHADPVKEPDDQYTYDFAGWDKDIVPVTGEETYTATFTAVPKKTDNPETGDRSIAILTAGLSCLICLSAVLAYGRKRAKSK